MRAKGAHRYAGRQTGAPLPTRKAPVHTPASWCKASAFMIDRAGFEPRAQTAARLAIARRSSVIHEGDKPQSTIDAPTGAQIPGSSALPHVMWLTRLRRRYKQTQRTANACGLPRPTSPRHFTTICPPRAGVFYSRYPMATRKTVKAEPAERTEICKECRFSHFKKNDGLRCRRFPPVFVYDYATGTSTAQWPEVDADAHCGEFKPTLSS